MLNYVQRAKSNIIVSIRTGSLSAKRPTGLPSVMWQLLWKQTTGSGNHHWDEAATRILSSMATSIPFSSCVPAATRTIAQKKTAQGKKIILCSTTTLVSNFQISATTWKNFKGTLLTMPVAVKLSTISINSKPKLNRREEFVCWVTNIL